MLKKSDFNVVGFLDGKEISVGDLEGRAVARVGQTTYFITGWLRLSPEQAACWNLEGWWSANKDGFLELLKESGALTQEMVDESQKWKRSKTELESAGFVFLLDDGPLLPILVAEDVAA